MSRAEFLSELSGLRRSVAELGDIVAADYLAHALACFAKGKDEAGEAWLRVTLELRGAQALEGSRGFVIRPADDGVGLDEHQS